MRHVLGYHLARTGRWAGRGAQIHNLPKPQKKVDARELLKYPDRCEKITDLKSVLRSLIIPSSPDNVFMILDYASIEARVLAWVSGQNDVVEAFRNNQDVYAFAAANILDLDDVPQKGSTERLLGKICTLGLGYGMGKILFHKLLRNEGFEYTLEDAERFVYKWRKTNSAIVKYWNSTMKQWASDLVLVRGELSDTCLRLPSGRTIFYRNISVSVNEGSYYPTYSKLETLRTGQKKIKYYNLGTLVENVVQATARDILAHHLVLIRPVFHIHDELIVEIPRSEANESSDVVQDILAKAKQLPSWASTLPFDIEWVVSERYGSH